MSNVVSQITLLQGYFKFLSLSMFFDDYAKHKILVADNNLLIKTGEKNAVQLDTIMIQKTLVDIYAHPDKKNIFGYLATVSGLRGVFSVTKDLMQQDASFESYLKKILGDQFYAFHKILFFCRNVLSHHVTADIILAHEDYEQQLFSLRTHSKKVLPLDIMYAKIFGEDRKGSSDYGLSIHINTHKILSGQKYTSIISWHDQWLLAELCYNLSEHYRTHMPDKPTSPKRRYTRSNHNAKPVSKHPRKTLRR